MVRDKKKTNERHITQMNSTSGSITDRRKTEKPVTTRDPYGKINISINLNKKSD